MRTRAFGIFCAILIGMVCFPAATDALTVSPALFDKTLDQGQKVQDSVRLFNETRSEQTYFVSVQNFVANGEDGQQSFLPQEDGYGLVKWVILEKRSLVLKPGESKDIGWAIDLPKDAEPGGHYAAIFFSTVSPSNADPSIGIGAKTGVLLLINVNGNIVENARLESFRAVQDDKAAYYEHLPVTFETRVRNDGSVHIMPTGKITITNIFGGGAGSIEMNPDSDRVLPGSIRRIITTWGGEQERPTSFFQELIAEWNGFALGRYTAKLGSYYGNRRQELNGTVTFWVFPWRVILMGFVVLCILIIGVRRYNRMIVHKALKRSTAVKG